MHVQHSCSDYEIVVFNKHDLGLTLSLESIYMCDVNGQKSLFLFDSLLPINNLSVIKGRVFLG